ncbi:MAG: peptidylprolyl isomerase [Bacteroidetes bacterium CG23_combo_of_CG06-09_8_20_14_all_32_9]|nr:MAG: peptidylprolyl isomerase [Bacteroidetes bacterium CG23_combo_of_CG06-09_8_20_14_all_32_9]
MKHSYFYIFSVIILSIIFFAFIYSSGSSERIAVINTKYGDIKIKLYNKTPLHRDNFVKLVFENFYNNLLFHRVIKDFMIQGGDPDSKNAAPGVMLGNGGPGDNIPAEILPGIYHKKGALAAAREADNINPKKESSGSQFYIVQGKVFTNQELDLIEIKKNQNLKNQILGKILISPENENLRLKLDSVKKTGKQDALMNFIKELDPLAEKELAKYGRFVFTPEQRTLYTTIGGTPHLDGDYTVFGEVIEGMNVVDSIAAVKKDKNDRPLADIKMKIKILN